MTITALVTGVHRGKGAANGMAHGLLKIKGFCGCKIITFNRVHGTLQLLLLLTLQGTGLDSQPQSAAEAIAKSTKLLERFCQLFIFIHEY